MKFETQRKRVLSICLKQKPIMLVTAYLMNNKNIVRVLELKHFVKCMSLYIYTNTQTLKGA